MDAGDTAEHNDMDFARKSLEHKMQPSLTAFFRPRQSNKDSGDTEMTPQKPDGAPGTPAFQVLVRCRCHCRWKINTFFLSVMLSASLSFHPPVIDRVTIMSICRLHVCVDLLSFSLMLSFPPMRFAWYTPLPSCKKASERRTAWVKPQAEPAAAMSHPPPLALFQKTCPP